MSLDAAQADRVTLQIEGVGSVITRYVVAADGMWSPTRKLLGLAEPGYLGEWHAFRQYARHVTGPARDRLYVWFEPDLLPGYMWSFPLPDGRVNIGFGIQRDGQRKVQDMKDLWPELLARPHIVEALGPDVELEDRHTAWPIPAGIDQATLTAGRVLFVGDAARATDTMTGEGIGQAVLTGRLAAEAIIATGALQPEVVCARYETEVRHHLLADHRMSALLSRASGASTRCPWRDPSGRHERLDATQLRPLDVRGRTPRAAAHPVALAPPHPASPRRLPTPPLTPSAAAAPDQPAVPDRPTEKLRGFMYRSPDFSVSIHSRGASVCATQKRGRAARARAGERLRAAMDSDERRRSCWTRSG